MAIPRVLLAPLLAATLGLAGCSSGTSAASACERQWTGSSLRAEYVKLKQTPAEVKFGHDRFVADCKTAIANGTAVVRDGKIYNG